MNMTEIKLAKENCGAVMERIIACFRVNTNISILTSI